MNKALKTGLWIAGIGGVAYAIYRFYSKQVKLAKDYDLSIVGVNLKTLSKNKAVFDIKTRFFNKSKIEVTVKKIYLDVYVEGNKIGYIQESKEFAIPAKGNSDIDLQISFNPQLLLKNAISILLGGVSKKDLNFTIDGYADIKSEFVRFTLPIKYSDNVSAYL